MSTQNLLRLLRYADLVSLKIVNNRMTLYRWMESRGFPRPLHLGPNSVAWRSVEVEAWLEERARRTEPPEAA